MTQLYLSHAPEDGACAAGLRGGLEGRGYTLVQDGESGASSAAAARAVLHGIRGSAALLVVWSSNAAQSEWVERHILLAQRLRKPIVPVVLDDTELPPTLVDIAPVSSTSSCVEVVDEVMHFLPPPDGDDLLNSLLAQSSHEYIRERKAAIQRAAEVLQRGEHREEMLALLEDTARNDLIQNVRDMAQSVLDAEAKREQRQPRQPVQSRHMFGAKCRNGHVTYFDKREVCPASGPIYRSVRSRGGAEVDDLCLKCDECGVEMIVPVDCEGYK